MQSAASSGARKEHPKYPQERRHGGWAMSLDPWVGLGCHFRSSHSCGVAHPVTPENDAFFKDSSSSWSLSTREHNYGNVCWWALSMLHQKDRLSLEVHIRTGMLMPTSPSGAGGAALSAWSLLLDDDRHRLRRRFAHPGPPRSAHTLP